MFCSNVVSNPFILSAALLLLFSFFCTHLLCGAFYFVLFTATGALLFLVLAQVWFTHLCGLIPVFILFGFCLPGDIRSDFIIVFGLAAALVIKKVVLARSSIRFEPAAVPMLVMASFPMLSGIISYLSNSEGELLLSSIMKTQYWFRVFILGMLAKYACFDQKTLKKSFGFFYLAAMLVCIEGVMETFNMIPGSVLSALNAFIPEHYRVFRVEMLTFESIRSSGILGSPIDLGFLALFMLWFTVNFRESLVVKFNWKLAACIFLITGFFTASKVFFSGVLFVVLFELFGRRQRRYLLAATTVLVLAAILSLKMAEQGRAPASVMHVVYRVKLLTEQGFYATFFKTRFDPETGNLAPSFRRISQNPWFGGGLMQFREVVYGDSFHITTLVNHGIAGLLFFHMIILYYILRLKTMSISAEDRFLRSLGHTVMCMLLFSIFAGIGTDTFTMRKLSEINYFFLFALILTPWHSLKHETRKFSDQPSGGR
ncbi:MAG: hypothetical protein PHQ23_11675 [Candidatus Wallbacteria bacterium]|nr:hypothetical protein [Candidatus Wallbacteria bacterium]